MAKYIFNVGDRVCATRRLKDKDRGNPEEGAEGVIEFISGEYLPYLVRFDCEFPNGHSGKGLPGNRDCYWCDPEELKIASSSHFDPSYGSIFDVIDATRGDNKG